MQHVVLFVDDEPLAIDAVVRSLRSSGLKLLTATSAREGLALLEQHPVEVVVSDQQMPGMQGHEFLEQVAQRWPSTIRLMLTGQAEFEVAQRAINRGHVHQFLVKPCDSATLLAALRNARERIELERSSRALLRIAHSQRTALDRLEASHPGITAVVRDRDGAVLLELPAPDDVPGLLRSMQAVIGGTPEAAPAAALPAAPAAPAAAAPMLLAAEEWRTIVDALDELLCFVDGDLNVIRASRALERWGLGDVKSVARRPLHAVLHAGCSDARCALLAWLRAACSPQAPGDGSSDTIDDPMTQRALRASCRRLTSAREDSRGERYLVILHDMTHVRALEHEARRLETELQQSQKLEAIGRLAAGVAHEINTPTQFVRDNLEFLRSSLDAVARCVALHRELLAAVAATPAAIAGLVEGQQEALKELDLGYLLAEMPKAAGQGIEGIVRIASIVRALKAFSHPGGGELSTVDLRSGLESTITVARNEWKYVAELETEFAPDLPTIEGYPGELNQVFLNLIVNAAQAIGEQPDLAANHAGRIKICVRPDGERVELRFSDNGPGIPPAIRHRIFEPFFTTKQIGKGTGQGLALAHSVIVRKHGGTIDFESEPGRGTTFILRLPIHAPVPAPVPVEGSETTAAPGRAPSAPVLGVRS